MAEEVQYTEDNIRSLDWKEHIRMRPGMYIGKLGDGTSADDGIYVLVKEVMDNCIDEFVMGYGKTIDLSIRDKEVKVRDYGRGIPLGKVVDCVSKINTGGKYDSKAFKKSVGLNGVGTKAVNALSDFFEVSSVRDGEMKTAEFSLGELKVDNKIEKTSSRRGTKIKFTPDPSIFVNYHYKLQHIERLVWNYCFHFCLLCQSREVCFRCVYYVHFPMARPSHLQHGVMGVCSRGEVWLVLSDVVHFQIVFVLQAKISATPAEGKECLFSFCMVTSLGQGEIRRYVLTVEKRVAMF